MFSKCTEDVTPNAQLNLTPTPFRPLKGELRGRKCKTKLQQYICLMLKKRMDKMIIQK